MKVSKQSYREETDTIRAFAKALLKKTNDELLRKHFLRNLQYEGGKISGKM